MDNTYEIIVDPQTSSQTVDYTDLTVLTLVVCVLHKK